MPPGWSRRAGSGPPPSAASAFTPRRRSRPHRIPVEPDLEREGVRAETGGFLGRFAKVLPHQGTHVAGRPDLLCITVRSRMVDEVFDDRPVRVARRPATCVSIRSIRPSDRKGLSCCPRRSGLLRRCVLDGRGVGRRRGRPDARRPSAPAGRRPVDGRCCCEACKATGDCRRRQCLPGAHGWAGCSAGPRGR